MPGYANVVGGRRGGLRARCEADLDKLDVVWRMGPRFRGLHGKPPDVAADYGFAVAQPAVREEAKLDDITLERIVAAP